MQARTGFAVLTTSAARFSIVFAVVALTLTIPLPARFGNLQVAAAFAQDTGLINACATKEQVRIVAHAGDCKKHETRVALVSSDGLASGMLATLQQSQEMMNDQKEVLLAMLDARLAAQAAEFEAKQQQIEQDMQAAQEAAANLFAVAMASVQVGGVVAVASPFEVMAALSDAALQSKILDLQAILTCSQDANGDGVPDTFDQCAARGCGESSPPACGGTCPDGGGSCVPGGGDTSSCVCALVSD